MDYFQISFIQNPAIDLLCTEAFQSTTVAKIAKSLRKEPTSLAGTKMRAKNYNSPVLRAHCKNCDEKEMCFKLIKKLTTCRVNDLTKFNNFWNGLKLENALMATQGAVPTVSFCGSGFWVLASILPDAENTCCHMSKLKRSQTFAVTKARKKHNDVAKE